MFTTTGLRRRVSLLVSEIADLPALRQDALLYLLAGVFAGGESVLAITADYREWGRIAVGPYLAAALACELGHRLRARRSTAARGFDPDAGHETSSLRRGIVFALLVAVVIVPLGLLVTWRAGDPPVTNPHGAQAQPEVAVIERAGDRFARFKNPYLAKPTSVGVSPSNDVKTVDADAFFPYLPGMVPFGLTNAASVPTALTDARLPLAAFTLIVVLLSLALVPASSRRRWRAFQFLVVLPTGALAMVTGGDDLPVLALLLLGLVFLQRRQPVAAGIAMGLAGTLKWTAWPLVALVLWSARDEDERRAIARYGLTVLLVAAPIVGAGAFLGSHAFLENVVLFPLGLTKIHSPAASPLPGQILVQLFPAEKKVLTAALIGIGAVLVIAMLVRRPPRTPYQAAWFAGWALAFATFIAPATRFGYLIYPANMFVWAYVLHERKDRSKQGQASAEARATPQLASAT
jgi:hypothetical protein